ncbi:putative mitochondrial Pif1 helicase-like protein [Leptomonas pyrrhocoris]|uniref:ATP-dependent DNA helicase n=1 Tax=Leptomonas pyrrhocoris TaxID=157538 RepID=A0A0M9FVU7_LEPPY|nr:putative mitochondrial Pif1 helicase-like protein [Leptomonas pyrrhocoris]KPA76936.1 putative mitochondrial Pif1 helicase-like protein [Leptomonas pyrrhocoris]|eukprot:XP_015655375.1 putative mitochondrial Pif1 helicase-like protein [Leptomonas pyrrhocoris]
MLRRFSAPAQRSAAQLSCTAVCTLYARLPSCGTRWQSTSNTATPSTGKRRGRPPGSKSRKNMMAVAAAAAAEAVPSASVSTANAAQQAQADAAVEAAVAAVAQQVFIRSPQQPIAPAVKTSSSAVEPPVAEAASTTPDMGESTVNTLEDSAPTTATRKTTTTRTEAALAPSSAPADAAASSSAFTTATAPADVEATPQAVVDPLNDSLDQESFFSSLLSSDAKSFGSAAHLPAELRESTLIYNALTGRMTSENSPTMTSLRQIGFGVNSERQVYVEQPDVLNALAARVRAGTAPLPSKWPVTLTRSVGVVIENTNISDPAQALQQMIQVKTTSMMRSRYASIVSAVGSNVDADNAEAATRQSLMENGNDPDKAIELNEEQKRVIDIALHGHHMYIGGSAGTGKTVLLRALARRLQGHRLRVAMTATTGVAGCHIGGSTFHHALGVSSRGEFLRRGVMLDYDVIIIDEVSMLPQSLFEEFDRVLREEAGAPDLPFGGVQIILCGDFLQLGCINESSLIGSAMFQKNFVKVRLETQVRQTANSKFANDLQLMRLGIVPSDLKTTVQQLPPGTMVDSAVNLLPTNKEVHAANEKELQRLPGDALTLTPETGITSLQCDTTATLLLRTTPDFNEAEFSRHVRSLLQATLDLPRASLLSLYRVYEDGHAMRVMLPPGESQAWREAMRERFLEMAGLLNDLNLGATVTEIVPKGDGLHTPETEEYLHKVMSKHPIAQPLALKKGCRVLLRANLSSNLVNGSIGTVVDFIECKTESFPEYIKTEMVERCIERYRVFCFTECGMPVPMVPVVQFHSGETLAIPPWEFSVGGGPNTHFYSLSSVALPLSLAYAFTVHKVQGLTLVGRVHLELSRMWPCEHLLYVAMSRVRNPDQLSMSSFSASMVIANDSCVLFDKALRGALQWTVADVAKFPVSAWKRCNDTIYHLRRRGSSLRRLLEGVTSMNGNASSFMLGGHSSNNSRGHQQQLLQSGMPGRRGLSSENDTGSVHGGMTSTADGSRVVVRVGEHGATDAQNETNGVFSLEHIGAIQQSVLVARRMRKLVKHVERVAKINDARRRSKAAEKSKADAAAAAAAAAVVATAAKDSSAVTPNEVESKNAVDGLTEAAEEDDESFDIESAASVLAVANRATLSEATLVLGEEHSF